MPVKDKSWYESAYGDVFVREYEPEKAYILKADINLYTSNVREVFNAAAFGIPVVTTEFVSNLTGRPVHIYWSDPNATPPDNEKIIAIATPIIKALEKKVLTGLLSEREQQELNANIQAYIKISGIHPGHINDMIKDIEEKMIPENFQNIIDGEKIFSFLSDSVLSSESRKIIIKLLIDESIAGTLQPDKKEQLDQAIQRFASEENIRSTAINASLQKIREKLKDAPSPILSTMKDIANEIAISTGAAHVDSNQKNYIILPINDPSLQADFEGFGFAAGDFPDRPPPLTAEQALWLTALHEAEHITQAKNRKTPFGENYPELSRTHVHEIDADYAALQALPPEDPIKDYWMQTRQVISFSKNFSSPFGMKFDHDTATPIRVFEATGMLIDLRAFEEEKKDLIHRVRAEFDFNRVPENNQNNLKIGHIMDATMRVLEHDQSARVKRDRGEVLSEAEKGYIISNLQRAESISFLEDAKAIGYSPNPNYPKYESPAPAVTQPIAVIPVSVSPILAAAGHRESFWVSQLLL